MTPQQKASELLHKFTHAEGCARILTKDAAKGCALICADEIIQALAHGSASTYSYNYWRNIKNEIEKL